MTFVPGTRQQFERRMSQRGTTLEAVRECIVGDYGDTIVVDVDHPAYPHATKPAPPARREWPLAARSLKRFRSEADKGVGDTLARVFNKLPVYKSMGAGDAFKVFMARIGVDCKCESRQAKLNSLYPYD